MLKLKTVANERSRFTRHFRAAGMNYLDKTLCCVIVGKPPAILTGGQLLPMAHGYTHWVLMLSGGIKENLNAFGS